MGGEGKSSNFLRNNWPQQTLCRHFWGKAPWIFHSKVPHSHLRWKENTQKNKRQNITTNIKIYPKSQRQQSPSCEEHQETLQRSAAHWCQGYATKQAQQLAQNLLFHEDHKTPVEFCYRPSPHWGVVAAAALGCSIFLFHVFLGCRRGAPPSAEFSRH